MVEMIQKYLKDEIELEYGKGLTRNQRKKGKIPVYGSNGIVDYNDKAYFKGPGIIIGRKGTVGSVNYEKNDFWAIDTTYVVKLKNENEDNIFWYYFLQTLGLERMNSHSAVPGLNRDRVYNIKINIPKKQEDREKISKILRSFDEKIELNNYINKNLHELGENIFKKIYENGIDCKLSKLVSNISSGSRPKGGAESTGIPSIGAEKIEKFGVYNYTSEKYISKEYFNKLKNGIVESGDVLLYKDGAYTEKVSMALNGFPYNKCAVNEHVFIIKTVDNWAKYYLYFTLYSKENKNKIFNMASSKAAQPGLNQTELKNLDIKLAEKEEIIRFEKSVEPIMFKIAYNALQNKTLGQLRDTLLPKLMNGQIDLDNIEI